MEEESAQAPLASVSLLIYQLVTPRINVIIFISHKSRRTHRKQPGPETAAALIRLSELTGDHGDSN